MDFHCSASSIFPASSCSRETHSLFRPFRKYSSRTAAETPISHPPPVSAWCLLGGLGGGPVWAMLLAAIRLLQVWSVSRFSTGLTTKAWFPRPLKSNSFVVSYPIPSLKTSSCQPTPECLSASATACPHRSPQTPGRGGGFLRDERGPGFLGRMSWRIP